MDGSWMQTGDLADMFQGRLWVSCMSSLYSIQVAVPNTLTANTQQHLITRRSIIDHKPV
uniref:Uncharacterized protein n=1 Tax=Oryza brachyantha TaxID=4533 RepID=J3MKF0_ORYBR